MKKFLSILLTGIITLSTAAALTSCASKQDEIMVYATSEDFRIENAQKMLNEKFPEYKITVQYKSTGELSAKLLNEGTKTDCDIVFELENSYLEKLGDSLAVLDGIDGVDFNAYSDDITPASHRYVPLLRTSGAIVINKTVLKENGLTAPTCYDDLLKPEYKGLISMPNPKSSGTGYVFYLNTVNTRGLDAALEYFDKLALNLSGSGFTSSGSGPVKALKLGEAAIGLCMTFQAVEEINNGADYEILYFSEGAPFNAYSSAIISGRETDERIQKIFSYIVTDVSPAEKQLYAPEPIYKNRTFTIKNFPENIPYGDMTGVQDITVKDKLLDAWKY